MSKVVKCSCQICQRIKDLFINNPGTFVLLSTALLYSALQIFFFTTERSNALPLWLLAGVITWRTISRLEVPDRRSPASKLIAWSLLGLVPLCLLIPDINSMNLHSHFAIFMTGLAIAVYCDGRNSAHYAPVLFLTLLIIPLQEQLFLALSYPLRLISTYLTVRVLRVFGCEISNHLTTIRMETYDIAITDACSGISQLAVLLFLGYIIILWRKHSTVFSAVLHYAALLPIIIFSNVLRLLLTILLFYMIGENAFDNIYHMSFGAIFVISATFLLYLTGKLFIGESVENQSEITSCPDH